MSLRFYLFTEAGLQRISHRVMEGLAHGEDSMPQFAGTKQRSAEVSIEIKDGKPVRITRASGSYLFFDNEGKVRDSLMQGGIEAMETHQALERAQRAAKGAVVDISAKLKREKWERENRWELSKQDLDQIADDIWKRKTAPAAKHARGSIPKAPSLTFEAREAIRELQSLVFTVTRKFEHLSEQALKGFAHEARKLSANSSDDHIWRGIADAADRRREILARHRTGNGTWYASIDVIRWDPVRQSGESVHSIHQKCDSKKAAEEVARQLLAENAKYFSADCSVEAEVVCDLEWNDEEV